MTFMKPLATAAVLAFLAACGAPDSIVVQAPAITETVRIGFRSLEVKHVSLPSYAAADEIAQQSPDGSLITSKVLWADSPDRAIGLELSRNLARLTRARIASEPWPFEEDAAAALDVRFSDLVAGTDGNFRAAGQYFVAGTVFITLSCGYIYTLILPLQSIQPGTILKSYTSKEYNYS